MTAVVMSTVDWVVVGLVALQAVSVSFVAGVTVSEISRAGTEVICPAPPQPSVLRTYPDGLFEDGAPTLQMVRR